MQDRIEMRDLPTVGDIDATVKTLNYLKRQHRVQDQLADAVINYISEDEYFNARRRDQEERTRRERYDQNRRTVLKFGLWLGISALVAGPVGLIGSCIRSQYTPEAWEAYYAELKSRQEVFEGEKRNYLSDQLSVNSSHGWRLSHPKKDPALNWEVDTTQGVQPSIVRENARNIIAFEEAKGILSSGSTGIEFKDYVDLNQAHRILFRISREQGVNIRELLQASSDGPLQSDIITITHLGINKIKHISITKINPEDLQSTVSLMKPVPAQS